MKNSITFLLTALALAIIAISHCAAFSGAGGGTVVNPYQITDVDQLQEMNDAKSSHYILMNDIDASATSSWPGGTGFLPIGNNSNRFTGSLDGRGYVISGLYINRPTTDFVGLFGYIGSGASATDVGLTDVDISGDDRVGGFCGWNEGAISGCWSSGNVSGHDGVGGFCGWTFGTVSDCWSSGNATGNAGVGGFCGHNRGPLADCYANGDASGSGKSVGGFCGSNGHTVTGCWSSGDASGGDYYVGGFCGVNYVTINDCYSSGNASNDSNDDVGGFCGHNKGEILTCYSSGGANGGDDDVGGFCGDNRCTISTCHSSGDASGDDDDVGGFCGENNGTISTCHSSGDASGDDDVGGFCGDNNNTVTNCYSSGDASGDNGVGGFCGHNDVTTTHCYSLGIVDGNTDDGGFCGHNFGTVTECFWDKVASGMVGSDGGTGKTTAEMKTQSTFTGAGWDFTNTWYMWGCPCDYPVFEPDPTPIVDVWISSSYCDGCGNDGHYWNCDAFDNMNDALDRLPDGGAGNMTYTGDLTLGGGKSISLGDYNLFVSGHILGADNNNYIEINGSGKLILQTTSAVTFHVGTTGFYAPCTITAPASNTFAVSVSYWGAFPSRCYWDIDHVGGGDPADIELIYAKSRVPSHCGDMTAESYVYHLNSTVWENLTPGGASTGDWTGNTSYYSTTSTCVTEFSPFAPVGASGLIPTLTEWAAIALGGLLLIVGGWFVWRRIG